MYFPSCVKWRFILQLTFSVNKTSTEKEDYKMLQTHAADKNRKAANVLVVRDGVLLQGHKNEVSTN